MQVAIQNFTPLRLPRRILSGIHASFGPGEVTAVLGRAGAGKTSLLHCLAGLVQAASGEILLDGEPLAKDRLELRRRLMFVPQSPLLVPEYPLLDQVAFHLKTWRADRPGVEYQVAHWITRLGLEDTLRSGPSAWSRGQRYKAALLCLLAVDPGLWLLDDPFDAGMDEAAAAVLRHEARMAAEERGRTVIYSTRAAECAAAFSHRIAFLRGGRLVHSPAENDFECNPGRIAGRLRGD